MRKLPRYLPLNHGEDSSTMSVLTRTYLVIIVIGFAVVLSLLYYVSSHMTTPQHRKNIHTSPGLVRQHTGSKLNTYQESSLSNTTEKSAVLTDDDRSHQIRILDETDDQTPYNTTAQDVPQTTVAVPNMDTDDIEDRPIPVENVEDREAVIDEVAMDTEDEKGVTAVKEQCRPHHASSTIVNTHPKFRKDFPLFVTKDYKSYSSVMNYPPPFGLKGTDHDLTSVLKILTEMSSMPDDIERIQCKRCIVVGSGGILKGKKLGPKIDDFDIVIRLNNAPVRGFQGDVGHKTTIRMSYPEGALQDPHGYDPDSLFLMVPFKSFDFLWLQRIIQKQSMSGISSRFWKSIAQSIPKDADKFRIVNPALLQETSFDLIGFPTNGGKMKKNVPTLGSLAIVWAINYCDEVSVAGFGYDLSQPTALLHYFESTKMSAINNSWTHNIDREKQFLKNLVQNGVVADLTGGILGHV